MKQTLSPSQTVWLHFLVQTSNTATVQMKSDGRAQVRSIFTTVWSNLNTTIALCLLCMQWSTCSSSSGIITSEEKFCFTTGPLGPCCLTSFSTRRFALFHFVSSVSENITCHQLVIIITYFAREEAEAPSLLAWLQPHRLGSHAHCHM